MAPCGIAAETQWLGTNIVRTGHRSPAGDVVAQKRPLLATGVHIALLRVVVGWKAGWVVGALGARHRN